MTRLDDYSATLQRLSRDLLAIAMSERRWDAQNIRAHAQTLDRIAFDLILDGDAQD